MEVLDAFKAGDVEDRIRSGPKTQSRNASLFREGMCSVTAVRLNSSSPRDRQPPEPAGQPADVYTLI
jgi:hypothetical protein